MTTAEPIADTYISYREAARAIGVEHASFHTIVAKYHPGDFHPIRIPGRRGKFVLRSEVERYMRENSNAHRDGWTPKPAPAAEPAQEEAMLSFARELAEKQAAAIRDAGLDTMAALMAGNHVIIQALLGNQVEADPKGLRLSLGR